MKATATVLLCFVVAGALAAAPMYNQEVIDSLQKCFNKNEIDEKSDQSHPKSKESCSHSCIMKSLNLMHADGVLDWDYIFTQHSNMSDEKFTSFMNICSDELASGKPFDLDDAPCVITKCLLEHGFFQQL